MVTEPPSSAESPSEAGLLLNIISGLLGLTACKQTKHGQFAVNGIKTAEIK